MRREIGDWWMEELRRAIIHRCEHGVALRVWRMGRTGHVCLKEAGIHYLLRPSKSYGELAVCNILHFSALLIALSPFEILHKMDGREMTFDGVMCSHLQSVNKEDKIAKYAAYYDIERKIAEWARWQGYDGIYYGGAFGVVQL